MREKASKREKEKRAGEREREREKKREKEREKERERERERGRGVIDRDGKNWSQVHEAPHLLSSSCTLHRSSKPCSSSRRDDRAVQPTRRAKC